ncbi:MAG: hypothetical protein WA485_03740 [Candidatus Sulfotelmatobacter sp.]
MPNPPDAHDAAGRIRTLDPFFSELRYPQELKNLGSVGDDESLVLEVLVARLQPFLSKVR